MIYAINQIPHEWVENVRSSLENGVGRFGWSYCLHHHDLSKCRYDIPENRRCRFLRKLAPGDYVVYINMPEYGRCTLAKVVGEYYFSKPEDMQGDFNHCFVVDPTSIHEFERNSEIVPYELSVRLKLRGRYWRIKCSDAFHYLLEQF